MADQLAQPQPLKFFAEIDVPQNTVADQNATPTTTQLQSDLQSGGLDGDTTLPAGTTVTRVWQKE